MANVLHRTINENNRHAEKGGSEAGILKLMEATGGGIVRWEYPSQFFMNDFELFGNLQNTLLTTPTVYTNIGASGGGSNDIYGALGFENINVITKNEVKFLGARSHLVLIGYAFSCSHDDATPRVIHTTFGINGVGQAQFDQGVLLAQNEDGVFTNSAAFLLPLNTTVEPMVKVEAGNINISGRPYFYGRRLLGI